MLLPDWAHNSMYVVGQNSILPVAVPSGVVGNPIALPIPSTTAISNKKQSAIGACIDPASGMIATVTMVDNSTGLTTIQLIDPSTGQIRSYQPPVDQFNVGGGCIFSGGLLYAGSGISFAYSGNLSNITAIDPKTTSIVANWPAIGVGPIVAIAASPVGVYALSQTNSSACYLALNCSVELDLLHSDGTYVTVSQWGTQPYGAVQIAVAPNGYVYAGGKAFDSNGLPIAPTSGDGVWAGPTSWPSSDPWYVYKTYQGVFVGEQVANSVALPMDLSLPNQTYLGVSALRQSDGTDLVVDLRSNSLDLSRVTPPELIYSTANSGLFESGSFVPSNTQPSFAPGSIITIIGQGLGAWNEYDVADTTKIVTQLGNTQVLLGDDLQHPLRLLFIGYNQINAILPRDLTIGQLYGIFVFHGIGVKTASQLFTVVGQSMADFMWSPDPKNPAATQPIITNGLYQLIGDPTLSAAYAQAHGGGEITFWATGGGLSSPTIDDSVAVTPTDKLYQLVSMPQVMVDGFPATVVYAGMVGGCVPGLDQVNFIVPTGLTPGAHDVTLGNILYKGGLWVK